MQMAFANLEFVMSLIEGLAESALVLILKVVMGKQMNPIHKRNVDPI